MTSIYTYEKKKKLAERISSLKNKNDIINIFDIIHSENKDYSESNGSIFMFFHNLTDDTYKKIDNYLYRNNNRNSDTLVKNNVKNNQNQVVNNFDDFTIDEQVSPKYKYSNQERNIIKRHRYVNAVNVENNTEANIVYQNFSESSTDNTDKHTGSANI